MDWGNLVSTSGTGQTRSIYEIYFKMPATMTIPTIGANTDEVIVYVEFILTQFDADLDSANINSILGGQRFPVKLYQNNVENTDVKMVL